MEEFEAYVQARSAALARTAYLLTGDVQHAEDLLQDTLSRVAERWEAVVRNGDPEAHVRKVMHHRAVDVWRRRRLREVSRARCTSPRSWSGATPVVTTLDADDESGTAVLAAATPKPLVVTEPGASITCIMLAAAAAAGEPHGGLFGTSTASWTWRAGEIALATAAGVALVLLWLRRRWRSR